MLRQISFTAATASIFAIAAPLTHAQIQTCPASQPYMAMVPNTNPLQFTCHATFEDFNATQTRYNLNAAIQNSGGSPSQNSSSNYGVNEQQFGRSSTPERGNSYQSNGARSGETNSHIERLNANGCVALNKVRVSYDNEPQYEMINNCGAIVHVYWCQTGSSKSRKACNSEAGKYYTHNVTLNAGERKTNQYSMPSDSSIRIAACLGGYGATKPFGTRGNAQCRLTKETGK